MGSRNSHLGYVQNGLVDHHLLRKLHVVAGTFLVVAMTLAMVLVHPSMAQRLPLNWWVMLNEHKCDELVWVPSVLERALCSGVAGFGEGLWTG